MAVDKEDADVLSIDRDRLDDEWRKQAEVYGKWCLKLADKKAELDIAESKLDVVVAELDYAIRKAPDRYNIAKVSEPAIKLAIRAQEQHQKATARVNRLKHEVATIDAYVRALDHKKKALENLVVLWMHDYFAEPRLPKNDEARERFEMKKRASARRQK